MYCIPFSRRRGRDRERIEELSEFLEVRLFDASIALPCRDDIHHTLTLECEVVENDLVEFCAMSFGFLDLINHGKFDCVLGGESGRWEDVEVEEGGERRGGGRGGRRTKK